MRVSLTLVWPQPKARQPITVSTSGLRVTWHVSKEDLRSLAGAVAAHLVKQL